MNKQTLKPKKTTLQRTKKDDLSLKKKAFILAYEKMFGNITATAQKVGVARSQVYVWLKEDPLFLEALQNTQPVEFLKDIAEIGLVKRIQEGDTTAIIFTLKSKAKDRGYTERIEHVNKNVEDFEGKTEEELQKELQELRDKHK